MDDFRIEDVAVGPFHILVMIVFWWLSLKVAWAAIKQMAKNGE